MHTISHIRRHLVEGGWPSGTTLIVALPTSFLFLLYFIVLRVEFPCILVFVQRFTELLFLEELSISS